MGRKCLIVTMLMVMVFTGSVISITKAAPAQKPIIWRFETIFAPPPALGSDTNAFVWFADELKKRTGGRLQIEIAWGSSLTRKPGSSFRLVGEGQLEISEAWWDINAAEVPWLESADYPALILGSRKGKAVINALLPMVKELANEKGFYLLANYPNTGVHIGVPMAFMMNKEIKTIEDFKGLIMRVYSPIVGAAVVRPLGMKPVLIPFAEIPVAIKTHVIDAVYTGAISYLDSNVVDVCKYCWLISKPYNVLPKSIIVNKKAFDALPSDLQEILKMVCSEFELRAWVAVDNPTVIGWPSMESIYEIAKKRGGEMIYLPKPIRDHIEKISRAHLEQWIEQGDVKKKRAGKLVLEAIDSVKAE